MDPSEKKKEIRRKLRKLEGLPTLPPILQKLNVMIEDERVSIHQIAELIEKDQVITSKVLRLANSAFYGFPKKVSTVQNALMLLGINVIKILITTSSIFEILHKEDVGLWEHSIGVAACTKIIAERVELKEPQEIATAGLLHDLGRVIQKVAFKEEYKKILEMVKKGKNHLDAEREILGIDHGEIGAYLMRQWNLPDRLIEAVDAHHELKKAKKFKKEAAAIHLADVLIHARGYGETILKKMPPLDEKSLKLLKLDFSDIKEIFTILEPRLYELKFFTEELIREAAE
jgi:putative nucleotidyltransferase with HDIG domain